MRVVLVNDSINTYLPLARLYLEEIKLNVHGAAQQLNLTTSAVVNIDAYDCNVAAWEPVLEPWPVCLITLNNNHENIANVIFTLMITLITLITFIFENSQ